jgi:4-hydroxythreonine-4-phosphate dehydrogenase
MLFSGSCSRTTIVQALALTLGEPAGIGPDLALAVWRRRAELDIAPFYMVADPDFLRRRAQKLGLDVPIDIVAPATAAASFRHSLPVVPLDVAVTAEPGRPDRSSAPAAIASIRRAVADVLSGAAAAVVTNPIAKNVLYNWGFAEPGHTEFLATLSRKQPARRCGR